MPYKIVRGIPNVSYTLLEDMGLLGIKIKRVWSILDEERMFEGDKFDTQTGEKIENPIKRTIDNPKLQHGITAFLEDKIHDWNIYDVRFKYYTRIAEEGRKMDLLIEHE
nr:hypothetical protein [Mycobacterium sp. E3298]